MNSREKKILTLTVNNFLMLALDIVALVRYKKGKTKQENYNTGQISRTIVTTANSLGILYLEEQERKEKKSVKVDTKELEDIMLLNTKLVKDISENNKKTDSIKRGV
ncbi:carboxypeptidase [Staphylococcus phage vB_SAP01]|nr:carboxypeptidase [Staphylococcus phage Biyabeda-mokiny_1]WJJ56985.1 carboxypeptidase [Staphylococcus phage vB_SAP01]